MTLLCLILVLGIVLSVCACDGRGEGGERAVDTNKSQLYIGCWDGGFGIEWLESIARRFEEFYADYSFESGKTGVQVWPTSSKGYVYDAFARNIMNSTDDICISEQCNYYGFVQNKSAVDITDAVTSSLSEFGETRSIADKLSLSDNSFYGVTSGETQKYYGLPWYESTFGFQYDIDMFEDNGYYFGTNGDFVRGKNSKRGNGPDGIEGTDDDGLPATYDQFFMLCDKIAGDGYEAVIWAGNAQVYINNLLSALAADYEGYEQMTLNYTLAGTATDLVQSISGNTVTFAEPTVINNENGYLLRKQAGYYYGLKFIERLLTTKNPDGSPKYFNLDRCTASTQSQTTAQSNFLRGRYNEKLTPVAMLIDGSWWHAESSSVFKALESVGAGALDRKIGFMPMPKVDENHLGPATYFNNWMTSINVRGNIEESKIPMAKAFIRFMHTDESLSEFTRITSGVRPFNYTLTQADEQLTSYYGKQLLDIHNKNTVDNPTIVNPWSDNNLVVNNLSSFMINDQMYNTGLYNLVATAMMQHNVSAKDYFEGLSSYLNKNAWDTSFSKWFNK